MPAPRHRGPHDHDGRRPGPRRPSPKPSIGTASGGVRSRQTGSSSPPSGLDLTTIEDEHRNGLIALRYGLGSILVVAGIALWIIDPGGFGVDGFAMAAGSGFSVILINYLWRLGVTGDQERDREEDARRYLAQHGRWPDQR